MPMPNKLRLAYQTDVRFESYFIVVDVVLISFLQRPMS
ncbi:unnamed protein product [Amoebophrya sp. A120]|nr:unnamed protein product [Amoebophrya sp. A120]|eukprot:GSA120T00018843001.1